MVEHSKNSAKIFLTSIGNNILLWIHKYINISVGVDYTDLAEVDQKMNYYYVVKDVL